MHRLIRVLVFGQNETEALDAARRVVQDHLVGDFPTSGAPFDNAVDFTNSAADSGGLSGEMAGAAALQRNNVPFRWGFGKDRYGDIPPVLQVSTTKFPFDDQRRVEQAKLAMDNIRAEFKRNMIDIRRLVSTKTDDELFDEKPDSPGTQFEWLCDFVSGHNPNIEAFLYDFHGKPISRPWELQRILDYNWYRCEDDEPTEDWNSDMWDQPLWIVPFDVHS